MSSDRIRNHAAFIWSVADLLRGDYKQSEYGKVILPLTVLRRLDCVLEPTKEEVLAAYEALQGQRHRERRAGSLQKARASSSTTPRSSTFAKLLDDPTNIAANLHAYMQGFSPGARDMLDRFDFDVQIDRLDKSKLLYQVVAAVLRDRPAPGRRVQPRDGLPLRGADPALLGTLERDGRRALHAARGDPADGQPPLHRGRRALCQARHRAHASTTRRAARAGCCPSAEDHLAALNPDARLEVFGQELNAESYAICRSDMMIKGQDASNIALRQLASPRTATPAGTFDYMLANPPFGVEWKKVEEEIRTRRRSSGFGGGSAPACPRSTTARSCSCSTCFRR